MFQDRCSSGSTNVNTYYYKYTDYEVYRETLTYNTKFQTDYIQFLSLSYRKHVINRSRFI